MDAAAQGKDGWTPLYWAVRAQRVDIVRLLAEHGEDTTSMDKYRSTPLHWASRMGSIDLARTLLEHCANVKAKNDDGLTPLHEAAWKLIFHAHQDWCGRDGQWQGRIDLSALFCVVKSGVRALSHRAWSERDVLGRGWMDPVALGGVGTRN